MSMFQESGDKMVVNTIGISDYYCYWWRWAWSSSGRRNCTASGKRKMLACQMAKEKWGWTFQRCKRGQIRLYVNVIRLFSWLLGWNDHNDSSLVWFSQVLISEGPQLLNEAVLNAEPYPIQGLFAFKDFFDEIDAYYHRTHGHEYGVSTGWKTLDNFYSVSIEVLFSLIPL